MSSTTDKIKGLANEAVGNVKQGIVRRDRQRQAQTTKIHALTDVLGHFGVLLLTPGNVSDVTTAPAVLAQATGQGPSPGRRQGLRRQLAPGRPAGKKASRRSSQASAAASGISATTSAATANAGASTRPSIPSRTSVASPPATTSWPATTLRLSRLPPSSPSGADRVQTLTSVEKVGEPKGRFLRCDPCEDLDVVRSIPLPLEKEVSGSVRGIFARRRHQLPC